MVKTLTAEESREILQPHLGTLDRIMTESLEDLNKALGSLSEKVNKRAKSALLHSIAIEKSKKYFKDVPQVVIREKYQSVQLIFDNKIVGRIKKVNNDNLSTNAKTKRNEAILHQQISLFSELFVADFFPSLFVDFGYKINETGESYDKLGVICRNDKSIKWHFSFKGSHEPVVLSTEQEDSLSIKEEAKITIKKVI